MKVKLIPTANVMRLNSVVDSLLNATSGEPRLGVIYGPAGRGKTRAVDQLAVMTGACFVSARRVWTPAAMLREILRALGKPAAVSAAENLERAATALRERQGVDSLGNGLLIVDEADYLCKGSQPPNTPPLLDTIRDLHDASHAPILLVGMDTLAQTLAAYKQFWDRVLACEEFQPLSIAEIVDLGAQLANLTIPEDVAAYMRQATDGNLRQTILYLVHLERMVDANGLNVVERDWVEKVEKDVTRRKQRAAGRVSGLRRVK